MSMAKIRTMREIALEEYKSLEEDKAYQKSLKEDLDKMIDKTCADICKAEQEVIRLKFKLSELSTDRQKCLDAIQGNTIVQIALRDFIKNRYPDEII